MTPDFIEFIPTLGSQKNAEELLSQVHEEAVHSIVERRNAYAGYARGGGLVFGELLAFLKNDPIYQESRALGEKMSYLPIDCLANLYLIMKYGIKNLCSQSSLPLSIIQCGSFRGGSALFMANAAQRLELPVTIYALDTFSGIPEENEMLDFYGKGTLADACFEQLVERKEKANLDNLFFIKGRFQETMPWLLPIIKKIVLAHIDCLAYASMSYALAAIQPWMEAPGGYLVIDHATRDSSSLGAFQAVEEMAQQYRLHAEQVVPHFVYRAFK